MKARDWLVIGAVSIGAIAAMVVVGIAILLILPLILPWLLIGAIGFAVLFMVAVVGWALTDVGKVNRPPHNPNDPLP